MIYCTRITVLCNRFMARLLPHQLHQRNRLRLIVPPGPAGRKRVSQQGAGWGARERRHYQATLHKLRGKNSISSCPHTDLHQRASRPAVTLHTANVLPVWPMTSPRTTPARPLDSYFQPLDSLRSHSPVFRSTKGSALSL